MKPMLFAHSPRDPKGLILTQAEATRQQAARRIKRRLATDAAARLLAARDQAIGNSRPPHR